MFDSFYGYASTMKEKLITQSLNLFINVVSKQIWMNNYVIIKWNQKIKSEQTQIIIKVNIDVYQKKYPGHDTNEEHPDRSPCIVNLESDGFDFISKYNME